MLGILPSYLMPITGLGLQIVGSRLPSWLETTAVNTYGNRLSLNGKTIQRWGAILVLLSGAARYAMRGKTPIALGMWVGSLSLIVAGDLHSLWKGCEKSSEKDDPWGKIPARISDNSQAVVDIVVKAINLYQIGLHSYRLINMSKLSGQVVGGSLGAISLVGTGYALWVDTPKMPEVLGF